MSIEPIAPSDLKSIHTMPDEVIAAFNAMIALHWNGTKSEFKQRDVIAEITKAMSIDRETVFARNYLNVESIYQNTGWNVYYDKPAYNESYEPIFTFVAMR